MTLTKNTPLRRLLAAQLAALITTSAWAQVAPAAPRTETVPAKADDAAKKPVPVETKPKASAEVAPEEETILLSPFEVKSDTKGYYAANTMSGTRFNTKLEDLASSMSIMTKDQMNDFAMLDINDVFLYTGNAEGTGTYTDYVVDRNGQVTDNVQLNPAGANRIRGITAANQSIGNFEVSGRMPVDRLLIDAIEISRGPNANVFGLGNTGGTVNQVLASANLTRQKTRIEMQGDSYEGWRGTFDHNVVLKKNVLAIRVSGGQQHEGFQRKPSGVDTRRLNAMIKFQPFRYTTISAAAIDYRMHGNRPNYTPPRDNVSNWIAKGRPAWNAGNSTYTINGVTYGLASGVVTAGGTGAITNDALLNDFFFRPNYFFQRSNLYVDQNGIGYWTAPVSTSSTSPFTNPTVQPAPNNFPVNVAALRLQLSGAGFGITGNTSGGLNPTQPLYATLPAVSNKSIYDWSEYNLSAVNRLRDSTEMYNVQLDQVILNTPTQNLTVQAAMLTENNERYSRTPIGNSGNSGVSGQLFVDVNSTNIDGTPNPYFGRTFIGVSEPRTVENPSSWHTYRGQFSYRLDLTQNDGLSKWLGTNQVSGYHEYKEKITRSYVFRDVMTSDHTWTASLAANTARANQSSITGGPQAGQALLRNFTSYYVGDANGNNVDYAPSTYEYGTYAYHFGTAPVTANPTTGFRSELANIGMLATTDGTGGTANTRQVIKTNGIVMQSQLFNGQLILTGGLRQDDVYTKFGLTPQLLVNNNTEHDYSRVNEWAAGDYRFNTGKTKTYGAVARPFREIAFVKKAAESSGVMRQVGQLFRGLAFTYNRADTFLPQAPAVDLQRKQLPNTTGEGTDMGLWINLFDNKLVIRVNKYENKQLNIRNGDANTYAQRVLRLDVDFANDNWQLHDVIETWVRAAAAATTPPTPITDDQVNAEIARVSQLSTAESNYLIENANNGTIAATNDFIAKGTEIEVNYNPNRYWTIAASAEEKTSRNANISNSIQEWIDRRMPVWTTIIDPRSNTNWWTTAYTNTRTPTTGAGTAENNFKANVLAGYKLLKQQDGKSLPNVRRYSGRLSTSYQLAGITDNSILKKFKIGGAMRYESKGAIGYYGLADSAGIFQTLDVTRPIYDEAHTYFDALISYKTKLFSDRVTANFQLNCRNIQESGRLQPIGVLPDGTPHTYRIVDPRLFVLSASFDL